MEGVARVPSEYAAPIAELLPRSRLRMEIVPYENHFREKVLSLVIEAWEPVFSKTRDDVPGFVYDNFWPNGWQLRQYAEVGALLDAKPEEFWLAVENDVLLGFVGVSIHKDDLMGEIVIIAVDPRFQRRGVGRSLMDFAETHIKDHGMKMVMVETVGDSGHEPARKAYESRGYVTWPVARYFKEL